MQLRCGAEKFSSEQSFLVGSKTIADYSPCLYASALSGTRPGTASLPAIHVVTGGSSRPERKMGSQLFLPPCRSSRQSRSPARIAWTSASVAKFLAKARTIKLGLRISLLQRSRTHRWPRAARLACWIEDSVDAVRADAVQIITCLAVRRSRAYRRKGGQFCWAGWE